MMTEVLTPEKVGEMHFHHRLLQSQKGVENSY
jgi:hypothetical protein